MSHTLLSTGLLAFTLLMTACGMEPSGGTNKPAANPNTDSSDKKDPSISPDPVSTDSANALPAGIAQLPEEYEAINTDEVHACHAKGKVFNRRTLRCSKTIDLATSFLCTHEGIIDGFVSTGYQIDSVLSSADADGFVIDQCGETQEGLRLVFFVRADEDDTFSIREIETSIK